MSDSATLDSKSTHNRRESSFLKWIFPEPRNYSIILWDKTRIPATEKEDFRLVINRPGAVRRMFKPPLELSLGEAFIYRDFDIQGDIFSAFALMNQFADRVSTLQALWEGSKDLLALPKAKRASEDGRGPLHVSGEVHTRKRDEAAVRYHYDVGNDFYSLWLDRNMQYSCGYFPTGVEDLDTAQERKMEHICRKLRLKPGERLLDVGCGWGGLIRYAARKYGVTATGVTLSVRQAEYARQRVREEGLEDSTTVELLDYRDLQTGAYDKIVSVGMFEHVGRSHLPEYFAHVYRLLKPGGLFLNHGIAYREIDPVILEKNSGSRSKVWIRRKSIWAKWIEKSILGIGSFGQQYIFPDGELELVSDVNLFGERAGFEVRDVENLREHYALTIRQWIQNLERFREEAIQVTNDVTYRTWKIYLASCVHGFETGIFSVNQTLFAKPVNGKSNLPLTREDLYHVSLG